MYGELGRLGARHQGALELTRREFVAACAAFLGGLGLGCGASSPVVGSSSTPEVDAVARERLVLAKLVETLLPFEHPRFPRVGIEEVTRRIDAFFPLADSRFEPVRQTLLLFDDTRGLADDEGRAREAGLVIGPAFAALSRADRGAYLSLWATSPVLLRRRVYRTARAMVYVSAYSMPELWATIGYEGPLLERAR